MYLRVVYLEGTAYRPDILRERAAEHEASIPFRLSRLTRRAHAGAALRLRIIAATIEAGR